MKFGDTRGHREHRIAIRVSAPTQGHRSLTSPASWRSGRGEHQPAPAPPAQPQPAVTAGSQGQPASVRAGCCSARGHAGWLLLSQGSEGGLGQSPRQMVAGWVGTRPAARGAGSSDRCEMRHQAPPAARRRSGEVDDRRPLAIRPCHGASVPSLGLRRVPALRAGPHVLALSTRWHRPALHRPRAAHSLVSSEASPGRLPPSRRRCAPKGGCVATGGIACPGALTRAGPALVAACCVAYTHAWMVRSRGDVAVRVSRSI